MPSRKSARTPISVDQPEHCAGLEILGPSARWFWDAIRMQGRGGDSFAQLPREAVRAVFHAQNTIPVICGPREMPQQTASLNVGTHSTPQCVTVRRDSARGQLESSSRVLKTSCVERFNLLESVASTSSV